MVIPAELDMIVAAVHAQRDRLTQARHWIQAGLAKSEGATGPEAPSLRRLLEASNPTPLGTEQRGMARALAALPGVDDRTMNDWLVLLRAGLAAQSRGDYRMAAQLFGEADRMPAVYEPSRAQALQFRAGAALERGALEIAEKDFREALSLHEQRGMNTAPIQVGLAACHFARGEREAADHALHLVHSSATPENEIDPDTHCLMLRLSLEQDGRIEPIIARVDGLIAAAARERQDGLLYLYSDFLIDLTRRASDVDGVTETAFRQVEATLSLAERVALDIASADPPWYAILFPALRGELLALEGTELARASTLSTSALARARAEWPDAVPLLARKLVKILVGAARWDEAHTLLATTLPEVAEQQHLKELAALQSAEIVVLTRLAAPPTDVDAALSRLHATLEHAWSLRLRGDTLLELASALPPDPARPLDPLALLEDAERCFLEMPSPTQRARCQEVMGDVHGARGSKEEALRYYLLAKETQEQHGLGLRRSVLLGKLKTARA
ncbi:hypothetical protein [Chondromyces crocatus]|uniref:MalT-like TPR region domain-containing protein n=1 Tax=Chondromyces crocatus TaxID=52 RepID=A0A0K1E7G6_CHOCO|nr:hypothetical protein [Chondromyces crocatus]AKT36826.1 uncharacterized protein CMC5_009470 [Chondromyces crocatus]